MRSTHAIRQARQVLRTVNGLLRQLRGSRAQLGDGHGNMFPDATDITQVYARIRGRVEIVRNVVAPAIHDLWVAVGRPAHENIFQVLGVYANQGAAGGVVPLVGPAPASYYMWGGQQALIIDVRQLRPFRPTVNNGMILSIDWGIAKTASGWQYIGPRTTDLSAYVPTARDTAALVLISMDTSGSLVVTDGADVSPISDLVAAPAPDSLLSNIPASPANTLGEICAVRVWQDGGGVAQATLHESNSNSDLIDLRFSVRAAGGVGVVAGNGDWKASCRVATTGNINLSSPGATIDGVTMASGDRVLVRAQSTGSQNGIYQWNGAASAMTRTTDADNLTDAGEVTSGMYVPVVEGTLYANSLWVLTTADPITVGSTTLTFTHFPVDGTGLIWSGNSLDVNVDGSTIQISSDQLQVKDAGISLAKLANLATQRVIGRNTGSTGVPEAVTATQVLDWIAAVQGYVLMRGASSWGGLAPGSAGKVLTSRGAGADLEYQEIPGSEVTRTWRWVSAGGTTFDFPDFVESIEWVADNGSMVDPTTYSLSSDTLQLVFDSSVTAGHVILSGFQPQQT